ncbi:MAG: tyrosine--tRNA ligase [Polyangiaceae bacterium]|jgi:tyrosyl-tRNA synthetase
MSAFPPAAEQLALLERGVVDFHVRGELEERLEGSRRSGTPLRVKAGFDPTRPDLHLGHTVLLEKMRQFQDLGHTAIFLIGDFTATVGDPTGQNDSRPRLTRDEVRAASETYVVQAYRVLDRSRVELRYNSEWLGKLSAVDIVELMAKYTVSRMLERKDFSQRFEDNRPIYQHEFLYPLLQGYDSVALQCDVELGGTDQLFNLLVGRDLMGKYGVRPQIVMTTPILEGTDARVENGVIVGKKMSKSAGNTVAVQDPPIEMFRKIMQIDDDVIFRFFELLSRRSTGEIATLMQERRQGRNPREIKAMFAREIVERYHAPAEAERAALEFDRVYSKDAIPEEVPRVELAPTGPLAELAWALKQAGLAESTSDARRKVQNGGVEIDGARATDPKMPLEPGREYLVRVGSKDRRFARIRVRP